MKFKQKPLKTRKPSRQRQTYAKNRQDAKERAEKAMLELEEENH